MLDLKKFCTSDKAASSDNDEYGEKRRESILGILKLNKKCNRNFIEDAHKQM